ncbi:MAG: OsmC family protein [Firmicutes bacterium]|nr:OsmC family protein [Bacillota bacterium]
MPVETVHIQWKGEHALESRLPSGKVITIDSAGPKPLEMVIASLGGCAGLTALAFAQKMRLNLTRLEIEVSGDLADGKVPAIKGGRLKYRLWGPDLQKEQVERLVELCEKYCPVYQTLKHAGPIEHSYEINPAS